MASIIYASVTLACSDLDQASRIAVVAAAAVVGIVFCCLVCSFTAMQVVFFLACFLTVATEIHTRQFNCNLNLRGNQFAAAIALSAPSPGANLPASQSATLPATLSACLPLSSPTSWPLSLTIMTKSG